MTIYDLAYTGPQIDELLASIKGLGLRLGGVLTPGATIETPLVDTFWFAPAGTYTYGESQTYTVNTGYLGIIQYMTGTEAWSTQQVLIGTDAAALAACQAAVAELSENLQDVEEQFVTMIPLWSASNVQIKNKTTYLATTAIGFEVGKTYRITIVFANSVSANTGFYLAPNPNSTTVNKWLASVWANTTSIVKTYTPPADSNYQYLYSYNNSPAVNGDILIEEIGEIDLQEELAELDEKDKVLKTSCGSLLNLYPDLNNAVIASNNTQHGRLYKVHDGERILVECTNLEYKPRYSFVLDYPYIGMALASHGWIDKPSQEIVSDVDGYLIICRTAEYPALTLYTLNNHVNYVAKLDEFKASREDIKFNHKLSYDASSLSVRSSATYADGVITLASGGSAKGTVNMFNDEVLITAVIKPTSNTFSIQFGQYYANYGTLFGLRTDGATSYLDLYAGTTLKASITLPFALASGVEYMMMIKRVTLDRSYVYLDIISDNGQRYSLNQYNTSSGVLGRMWGALYCASLSGTCEVKNINIYSPNKSGCKVAVVGHSFVEGYSIEGMRLQRFARLLQDVLGKEECGIFGQGGCKMADSLTLIQNYIPQYNPQYVLCCVGTNDNSMTLSAWKTWRNNIISACNAINATPVFFTIPPDQGAYEGEWNSINAFIRTCGSLYVDMDKCFVNNGSPVAARYLYDNTHPNPATHHSIFARILQDIPDLL